MSWRTEAAKAIEESRTGGVSVYLDGDTRPLAELRDLTPEQAATPLPGAGNSVLNQVRHLITSNAMTKAMLEGTDMPDLDWGADWAEGTVTETEWQNLLDQMDDGLAEIANLVKDGSSLNEDDLAGGGILAAVHTAYHMGQIRHAAGYAKQA